MGQKPTATVRPLKSTPYPMSIQATADYPINRQQQYNNFVPMDYYDQMTNIGNRSSSSTFNMHNPIERMIQFDRGNIMIISGYCLF